MKGNKTVTAVIFYVFLLCVVFGFSADSADGEGYFIDRLPYPAEWAAPDGLPQPPGDSFQTPFIASEGEIPEDAPKISQWNRVVHPGEGFTMTGIRFTLREEELSSTDTTVWVWCDTPEGGELHQADVWFVREDIITATLPDDIPFGMYIVWVENDAGISAPAVLNRTSAEWIGPMGNTVKPGEEKRVFGKNLASGHGTETSHVFLRSPDGEFHECAVTDVEPYSVTFRIPEEKGDGEYEVYVHNGHGGPYGWSEGLALEVDSTPERGDAEKTVYAGGNDANRAIQEAINAVHEEPDGGTVRLEEGEYEVQEAVELKEGVRLVGAGKEDTVLSGEELRIMPNTAMENMTVSEGIHPSESAPETLHDVRIANVSTLRLGWRENQCEWYERIEIADSDIDIVDIPGNDVWVHGNISTGDRMYEHAGIYPYGRRVVIERNHFRNEWPVDEEGEKQLETSDDIPREHEFAEEPGWIARMVCVAGRGYKPVMDNHYIAHNTTEDVTSEGNIGEMILFHDHLGSWFGRVENSEGKRLTVCTEGIWMNDEKLQISEMESGGEVRGDPGDYVVIIGGTGIGQARRITEINEDSITVENNWRIEPDSSSNIVIAPLWVNNIVYKNELNAFPEGYRLETQTASTGINMWGNTWGTTAEGNVARRTAGGRNIRSIPQTPSYWNELRNEKGLDKFYRGAFSIAGGAVRDFETREAVPVPGSLTLGNVFRGGVFTLNEHPVPGIREGAPLLSSGATLPDSDFIPHAGNIIENIDASEADLGISHDALGMTLMRNNELNLSGDGSVGASIHEESDAMLSGNRYVNADREYEGTGRSETPVALNRVAHFHGDADGELEPAVIPVANAGIHEMHLEVVSEDDWIAAEVKSDQNFGPESMGSLEVSVDTALLETGTHTGYVMITTENEKVTVGVRVKLE